MTASSVLHRLFRVLCLLLLVLGQSGHAPIRVAVPQAQGLLLADAGAHVPVLESRMVHLSARSDGLADPPERPVSPGLPVTLLPPFGRQPGALPVASGEPGPRCGRDKGFWACGPPLQPT